jgi:hypothetical protein
LIYCCYINLGRVERHQRENEGSMTLLKNTLIELEARMCNGVYLWRITGYARHLENARDNVVTALHSPQFYTNFYGYKLCLRYVDFYSVRCRKVTSERKEFYIKNVTL